MRQGLFHYYYDAKGCDKVTVYTNLSNKMFCVRQYTTDSYFGVLSR